MHNKILLILLIGILFINCGARKKEANIETKTVTIQYSEMYCGGAAPPDELIRELSTKKPYTDKSIEVFLNNELKTKPLLLKTNAIGEVVLPCNIGTEVFINIYESDDLFNVSATNDKIYVGCYKKFIIDNLVKINLRDKQKLESISFYIECDPCLPPAP